MLASNRRILFGALAAALVFALLVAGPITVIMGRLVPAAAWALYWGAAFSLGLLVIVPPYLLITKYVWLPRNIAKLIYMCVVFALGGLMQLGFSAYFHLAVGWLAGALFAGASSLVFWYVGGANAALRRV
jgi:hypothetical protein